MMKGYVAALKSKPGEFRALRQLSGELTSDFVPLIEVVEQYPAREDEEEDLQVPMPFMPTNEGGKSQPAAEAHIREKLAALPEAIGERCIFLDPHEVAPLRQGGEHGTTIAYRVAQQMGVAFRPVVRLSVDTDVQDAYPFARGGFALRVAPRDVRGPPLARIAADVRRDMDCPWDEVDVILFPGELAPIAAARERQLRSLLEFAAGTRARSLTLCMTSMPFSIGSVRDQSPPRHEWALWRRLRRDYPMLRYGDHGVQHPSGVERGKGYGRPPANIRYTRPDSWRILRGESAGAGVRPTEEYPRLARSLCETEPFFNAFHCPGCRDVLAAAEDRLDRVGNHSLWRGIGTAHHLKLVTQLLQTEPAV